MISIITTGGTIEGLEYEEESNKKGATVSIEGILEKVNALSEYQIDFAFSKDSRFITSDDRLLLKEKILTLEAKKILITHGTVTMVETAIYLGKLKIEKTIVLVGSFIPGHKKNTDAVFNLRYAISAVQILKSGVYIAMSGNVFPWDRVKKNITKNRFEYTS